MKKLPPIIPVREIPETFGNEMSPIEWLSKLTKAYNDIAATVYDITVDKDYHILKIKERGVE